MLKDIVQDFVIGNRVVITSSTNNGCSSFALYVANTILNNDNVVLYYNPSRDIDREFVKKYYPRVHKSAIWIESPLDSFLEVLHAIGHEYDCLIIDPGDVLMIDRKLVPTLGGLRKRGSTIIFTSQIRQDPNKGWAPYSTLEKLKKFDSSIWITNVTGSNPVYNLKYIDVFQEVRSGNNYIARAIAKYTDEGNIVE